jgi:hypothetical protein
VVDAIEVLGPSVSSAPVVALDVPRSSAGEALAERAARLGDDPASAAGVAVTFDVPAASIEIARAATGIPCTSTPTKSAEAARRCAAVAKRWAPLAARNVEGVSAIDAAIEVGVEVDVEPRPTSPTAVARVVRAAGETGAVAAGPASSRVAEDRAAR